ACPQAASEREHLFIRSCALVRLNQKARGNVTTQHPADIRPGVRTSQLAHANIIAVHLESAAKGLVRDSGSLAEKSTRRQRAGLVLGKNTVVVEEHCLDQEPPCCTGRS